MSSDFPAELQEEFLDDFYAECDELLGNIRAALTRLDEAVRASHADAAAVEALYRSVHSLKGISAIVGLRVAEELAHATEGLLRLLTRGDVALAAANLDLLGQATQRLEQIVTAHRLKHALPEIADLLDRLATFNSPPANVQPASPKPPAPPASMTPTPAQHDPADKTASPKTALVATWRASFSPSPALDERGVNINTVRARLAALGEIVSAVPAIKPGGRMSFDFTLAVNAEPTDLGRWEADGIVLQPHENDAVAKPTAERPSDAVASNMFVAPSHIVRVDLSRLDELMRIVGEMVIHRSRLEERIASGDRSALHEVNLALGRSLREMREGITRVRLVPVAEIFSRVPFVVRDLARETGKKVRLVMEGQETEIDKYLVERLKEPLLHLVRNAISHGIEKPADRVISGKPEEATLTLRASTSGQSVLIEICDDGRGIVVKDVVARARAAGIAVSDEPGDSELLNVLCRPGFSTRDEADRAAGRGVGMAVVQNTVRDLAGSLSLQSNPGWSTQFTLRLPLTLSIAETFLVSAAGQTCAVAQGFVEEIVQFAEADVRTIQQAEVISYRDGILPLVRLPRLFGAEKSTSAQLPLLVLSSERGLCGLVVDRVIGQREVVVRAMQDPLIRVPGISGATELGDGRPVLILDAVALCGGVVRPRNHADPRRPAPMAQQA